MPEWIDMFHTARENIISQAMWCGGRLPGLGPLLSCIMMANAGVRDVPMDIRI